MNITIFEKTDRIGGRTLTVNAYDSTFERVELGASIFIKLNHIMWNATQTFNLTLQEPDLDESGVLAVWDGDKFVYQQDYKSWSWWNYTKLFWKYGMAPYRTNKLMQAIIGKFLNLYQAPYFPFRSLTTRAYELELTYVTGQTGEQFLAQNRVRRRPPFQAQCCLTRPDRRTFLPRHHPSKHQGQLRFQPGSHPWPRNDGEILACSPVPVHVCRLD